MKNIVAIGLPFHLSDAHSMGLYCDVEYRNYIAALAVFPYEDRLKFVSIKINFSAGYTRHSALFEDYSYCLGGYHFTSEDMRSGHKVKQAEPALKINFQNETQLNVDLDRQVDHHNLVEVLNSAWAKEMSQNFKNSQRYFRHFAWLGRDDQIEFLLECGMGLDVILQKTEKN